MAIIFRSEKYPKIKVDSHIIIGITGCNYKEFLKGLTGADISSFPDNLDDIKVSRMLDAKINAQKLDEYLNDLGLDKSFLNKNIHDLSHGQRQLLKYLQILISDNSIIVLDEPFMDLDYDNKKRIIALFHKLVKKKTIIIGSVDMNIIYTQCKKVLLLNAKKYLYDDVNILANKRVLKQFHIEMPEILEFIRLAKEKRKKLPYSKDIRDLIKDVYKNVSK